MTGEELRKQYEQETGIGAHDEDGLMQCYNDGYVEWLEKKLAPVEKKGWPNGPPTDEQMLFQFKLSCKELGLDWKKSLEKGKKIRL